jgi:diguanylate cyclase (GGDEF)-like protein
MARSFAALYGAGGTLVGLTLLFPHPPDRMLGGMLAVVGSAAVVAVVLLLRGSSLPLQAFYLLPPLGTLLVGIVSYSGGTGTRATYSGFFFWAIASAFYFFPRRAALPNLPLVAVVYAAVMLTGHERFLDVGYFVPMTSLGVTALLIDRLNRERNRLGKEVDKMITRLDGLARTDPLTGLPNRREFEHHLQRELARAGRSSAPTSVLMLDLDHFKAYNDAHGHLEGDHFLRATARSWQERLRTGDLLVRFGGEEFAAILPVCDLQDAAQLAERLRECVPQKQTCSVGVAEWKGQENAHELVGRADDALLSAKRGGRNRVHISAGAPIHGSAGAPDTRAIAAA